MELVGENQFIDIDKKKQVLTYMKQGNVRLAIICRTNPRFVNQIEKFKGTYL